MKTTFGSETPCWSTWYLVKFWSAISCRKVRSYITDLVSTKHITQDMNCENARELQYRNTISKRWLPVNRTRPAIYRHSCKHKIPIGWIVQHTFSRWCTLGQHGPQIIRQVKVWLKVIKVKGLDTCYSAAYISQDSRTAALYSIWSDSWLAWANDTAAHYAAIHCPR